MRRIMSAGGTSKANVWLSSTKGLSAAVPVSLSARSLALLSPKFMVPVMEVPAAVLLNPISITMRSPSRAFTAPATVSPSAMRRVVSEVAHSFVGPKSLLASRVPRSVCPSFDTTSSFRLTLSMLSLAALSSTRIVPFTVVEPPIVWSPSSGSETYCLTSCRVLAVFALPSALLVMAELVLVVTQRRRSALSVSSQEDSRVKGGLTAAAPPEGR